MKKYIVTLVITQALCLSVLFAQGWEFKIGEEDWGETLYATQKNAAGATITIFTAKEEFKPSILIAPYKPAYGQSFTVEISVDKGQLYRLKGSNSDYFGEIQVEGIEKQMLQQMMIGSVVSINLARKDTLSFSLTGSSKAIGVLDRSMQKEDASQKESLESENAQPAQIAPSYFEGKWEIRTYGYNFKKDGNLILFNPDDGEKLEDGKWKIEGNQLIASVGITKKFPNIKITSPDSWEWIDKKDETWEATRIK
jgi:hypothetical protein